jgi:hypothetical protein
LRLEVGKKVGVEDDKGFTAIVSGTGVPVAFTVGLTSTVAVSVATGVKVGGGVSVA